MKVARVNARRDPILSSPSGVGGGNALPALDDLTDVDTSGVADGDTIVYDSGTSTWLPGAGGGSSLEVDDDGVSVSDPTNVLDFTTGLVAVGPGPTATVSLDDAYVTALIEAVAPTIPPTVAYFPVMVDNPNIVTTDGNVIYTVLTTVDGDPIMGLVAV